MQDDDRQRIDEGREDRAQGYFVRSRGVVSGPFSAQTLRKLFQRGVISRLDQISSDDGTWTMLDESSLRIREDRAKSDKTNGDPVASPSSPADRLAEMTGVAYIPSDVSDDATRRLPAPEPDRSIRLIGVLIAALAILCAVAVLSSILVSDSANEAKREIAATEPPRVAVKSEPSSQRAPISKSQPVPAPIHLLRGVTKVITSARDETNLSEAVGLVVAGFEFAPSGMDRHTFIQRPVVSGSCFLVSPSGDVVTNKHVIELVEQAEHDPKFQQTCRAALGMDMKPRVWVFFGGTKYSAEVSFVSSRYDLALLRVRRKPTAIFRLSTSSNLSRGQDVFALGFPGVAQEALSVDELKNQTLFEMGDDPDVRSQFKSRDFQFTLTKGGLGRIVSEVSGPRWIQHEAVVRHGNSGGPLVDEQGLVVGINTRIQKNDEGDVQTNMALDISQLRTEIESHTDGTVWSAPRIGG